MSSQANSNPNAQEPTMEEILASIRKIISEDQPADGGKTAARPAPVKAAPAPAMARAPIPAPAGGDLDVLDLTDEVHDDDAAQSVKVAPLPAIENDVIFQNIDPPARDMRPMDDDLISDSTRNAMGKAFANLGGQAPPQFSFRSGSIEAIFAEAVQDAFRPALKEWIDDHSNDVMEQLRPLIRAWMDEHLPPLVQAAVAKEITRAAEKARKA